MARKPGKKDKLPDAIEKLLDALKFVQLAQKLDGETHETHCRFGYNTISAFNGITGAGVLAEHDLIATPHTYKLIAALNRCKISETLKALTAPKTLGMECNSLD